MAQEIIELLNEIISQSDRESAEVLKQLLPA